MGISYRKRGPEIEQVCPNKTSWTSFTCNLGMGINFRRLGPDFEQFFSQKTLEILLEQSRNGDRLEKVGVRSRTSFLSEQVGSPFTNISILFWNAMLHGLVSDPYCWEKALQERNVAEEGQAYLLQLVV